MALFILSVAVLSILSHILGFFVSCIVFLWLDRLLCLALLSPVEELVVQLVRTEVVPVWVVDHRC